MKIVAIYQGDGSTVDNLTVITDDRDIFRGTVAYLGCDEYGGTGFSQWGEMPEKNICRLNKEKNGLVFEQVTHIGKLINFTDLNRETQKHIAERVLL